MTVFAERIAGLRALLAPMGVNGFVVPRNDEHLGEYVPACAERLAWLTGFTGSAGLAAVLEARAAVFTDGRYTLQLEAETDAALWERAHSVTTPPETWLAAACPADKRRIGYDPMLLDEASLARYAGAGLTMVPLAQNPVDAVWRDRPAPPASAVVSHPLRFAGVASAEKRAAIAAALAEAGQAAAVISDPASVAWLLNLRGADVPFTPFALAFAIVYADARVTLFIGQERIAPDLLADFGNAVSVKPRALLAATLAEFSGQTVRVANAGTPAWFAQALRGNGAAVAAGADPCALPKACKNNVEQEGMRAAHARDGIAVCRFLHWLSQNAGSGAVTELQAAATLRAFREALPDYRGESFPAISGAGPHGAIIHYRVSETSDRALGRDEVYLIDSGAQFPEGTTDITRTVWTGPGTPPDEIRERFTRVLQGHIAIATLIFPEGIAGPHIDAFARSALWRAGLDYDHGTGHGVGSYLSVHEGPVSISRAAKPEPLAAGMVLSNEPGFYLPDGYGIRLENLLLVRQSAFDGKRKFLGFETLTLAPFDRRLIDIARLTVAEREWIDDYHARVLASVGPGLPAEAALWLAASCQKLS